MKIQTTLLIFVLLMLSCSVWKRNNENVTNNMAAEFENPPTSARPGVFWCWLNGNMTNP